MCGRYMQHRGPAEVAHWFGTTNPLPNLAPSWNRAPTQDVPVVRRHPETGARHLDALRWGLVPRWSKDATGGARMINARAEGIEQRPAFREAFARRRCLVVADGFYEWRKDGRARQAFAVTLRENTPMALAGLWEGWRAPDGTVLRTCTIITTNANDKLAPLHERMPVILPREHWEPWLGEYIADTGALLALLRPYPADGVRAWPIGPRVGKVTEDDAHLLARDPNAMAPPGLDDPPPWLQGTDGPP